MSDIKSFQKGIKDFLFTEKRFINKQETLIL